MAALNAAGLQRQLTNPNGRAPPSHMPIGSTSSGSFHPGMSHNQQSSLHQDPSLNMPFNPAVPLSAHQPSNYSPANTQLATPSLDPTGRSNLAPRQPNAAMIKQKQRGFLSNLATHHNSRGMPLPPALTGVPYPPNYDPANSCWKNLECVPGEIGIFRLGGKDIELLKLWAIVLQYGGGVKVCVWCSNGFLSNPFQVGQQNGWPHIIRNLDLPDVLPGHNQNTAGVLAHYYANILQPFEEIWRRNYQEKMMTARPAGTGVGTGEQSNTSNLGHPGAGNTVGVMNQGNQNRATTSPPILPSQPLPQSPHPRQVTPGSNLSGSFGPSESLSSFSISQSISGASVGQASTVQEQHEQDIPTVKRKLEPEEADGKRAKPKTGESWPLT